MTLEQEWLDTFISLALAEDIGTQDITSTTIVPQSLMVTLSIVTREAMIVAGLDIAAMVFHQVDRGVTVTLAVAEGDRVPAKTVLAILHGPALSLLKAERVALNFIQTLSGMATLTSRYVDAVLHTKAKIKDTRKTLPLWRDLSKYAVRVGGGVNHRIRLDDGLLIKDNHIAMHGEAIEGVVRLAKKCYTGIVMVECDTIHQVTQALEAGADYLLLDNMKPSSLKEAVLLVQGRVPLEASGGVTLENVKDIAETGVDFISTSAITMGARAIDIGLDWGR
jgi:nicotinate-nucleotide pyrophosphorylase (carboxylating)